MAETLKPMGGSKFNEFHAFNSVARSLGCREEGKRGHKIQQH